MTQKDGPSWLSDAAKALGEVTPSGEPLALSWNQVLNAIRDLRAERDALKKAWDRLSSQEPPSDANGLG